MRWLGIETRSWHPDSRDMFQSPSTLKNSFSRSKYFFHLKSAQDLLDHPKREFNPCNFSLRQDMATILIVDDRPTNRELLVTLLGYAGHRMLEAAEGEEGLVVARAEHPDLIITDIVMPTMDGYEFARQVRADPSISATQIIFYTSSYIVAETRRLAEACGVSIVISKPIEPQELLETVKAALDSKQKPVIPPASEDFHREHMRLLTDTLAKKVEELEAEITERKRAEEAVRESEEQY